MAEEKRDPTSGTGDQVKETSTPMEGAYFFQMWLDFTHVGRLINLTVDVLPAPSLQTEKIHGTEEISSSNVDVTLGEVEDKDGEEPEDDCEEENEDEDDEDEDNDEDEVSDEDEEIDEDDDNDEDEDVDEDEDEDEEPLVEDPSTDIRV